MPMALEWQIPQKVRTCVMNFVPQSYTRADMAAHIRARENSIPIGRINALLNSLIGIGDVAIEDSQKVVLMDQAGRMGLAVDFLGRRIQQILQASEYSGYGDTAKIVQASIDATAGGPLGMSLGNYPFNISVYRWANATGLHLFASTPMIDPLHSLYPAEGGQPSGYFGRVLRRLKIDNQQVVPDCNIFDANAELTYDEELVNLYGDLHGPNPLLILPLRGKNTFCGLATFHRIVPGSEEFYPENFALQWQDFNALKAKFSEFSGHVGLLLERAALFESAIRLPQHNRYLPDSQVVDYRHRDEIYSVEIMDYPGHTDDPIARIIVERTLRPEMIEFAREQLGEDITPLIDNEHLPGRLLLTVRNDEKLLAYAGGMQIPLNGHSVLYLSGTILAEEVRNKALHIFLNGLLADRAFTRPCWVCMRTAEPQLYRALEMYTSKIFPSISGDADSANHETALKIAEALGQRFNFTVEGFVARDVYKEGLNLNMDSGRRQVKEYFNKHIIRWPDGSPKDGILVVAYLTPDSLIPRFTGDMTSSQIVRPGSEEQNGQD
ncbi:MAG: hypothetical protein AABZ57_07585 [Candidatus Margulisiibacteriota bacterium]